MARSSCLAALVTIWLGLTPLLAASPQAELKGVLPGKELAGWRVVADTYLYVAGNDLTQIYNGGFERYLKAGVTAAAQQTYQGPGTLTVTAHAMRTEREALAFYKSERPTGKQAPKVTDSAGGRAYQYTAQGVTTAVVRGPRTVVVASLFGAKQGPAEMAKVCAALVRRTGDRGQPRSRRGTGG